MTPLKKDVFIVEAIIIGNKAKIDPIEVN